MVKNYETNNGTTDNFPKPPVVPDPKTIAPYAGASVTPTKTSINFPKKP
jgi:hypothetical protein